MTTSEEINKKTGSLEKTQDTGSRCEVKVLEEKYSKHGELEVTEKKSAYKPNPTKPFSEYAITVKRVFNREGALTETLLTVNSPQLLNVFKNTIGYYPAEPSHFDEPITITDPFSVLFHYREELAAYRSVTDDDTTKLHIDLLVEFLNEELNEDMNTARKLTAAGFITFPLLWTIFKPGQLLHKTVGGHSWLYRLEKTNYAKHATKGNYFEVHGLYTGYDGDKIGKAKEIEIIWEKMDCSTPTEITELPVFPAAFLGDIDDLKVKLADRGKRFLDLQGRHVKRYDGTFMYHRTPGYDFYDEDPENYGGVFLSMATNGRIVLDTKTFCEEFEAVKVHVHGPDHVHAVLSPPNAILKGPGEDPLLCPPFLYGFCLTTRKWGKFFIDQVEDVEWKENAFEDLLIPEGQKTVIRALISAHKFPEKDVRDVRNHKGKGLVLLLHGTPGSGKTLTAETVAEHTKRPLIIVSSGELGDYKYEFRSKLTSLLRYATIFKAVVLIDEADVFLEARESEKLTQNGLVAVFLEQLEYFHGILFLTTNRISVFDPAIKSRIHLALQYSSPDQTLRRKLWQQKIKLVPEEECDVDMEKTLDALQDINMNGREIANSINTARTLALDAKVKMNYGHIESIVQIWSQFEVALNASNEKARRDKKKRSVEEEED